MREENLHEGRKWETMNFLGVHGLRSVFMCIQRSPIFEVPVDVSSDC